MHHHEEMTNHSVFSLYLGILKNNQGVTNNNKIKTLRYFGLRSSAPASKANNKMDKQRLRITLKVLNEVKAQFPETKEFIEERLKRKCFKENISVEKVIFVFTSLEAKI